MSPLPLKKHLRLEERSYYMVPSTQETLILLTEYLKVIVNLSFSHDRNDVTHH
jgi:hypothetical protein